MSTALVKTELTENELLDVLKSSLYVGAQDASIKLVLGYCKASGLDPMQKPVHIVPMYCATGEKDSNGRDIKAMRDVVMPGVGLYRIQASKTREYAGTSEPEYGEDITEELDGVKITYPKWCKIIVRRLLKNGVIAEFAAKEVWKENYATKKRDSIAPNAMWQKRPYGQIAKCAEAQALRKAFPDEIGSQPTADEMEGKEIDITPPQQNTAPKQIDYYDDENFTANSVKWKEFVQSGKQSAERLINFINSKQPLSEAQKEKIKSWELNNENS